MYRWKYKVENTPSGNIDNLVRGFEALENEKVEHLGNYIFGHAFRTNDLPEGAEVCTLEKELLVRPGVKDVECECFGYNQYSFKVFTDYEYYSCDCHELRSVVFMLISQAEREVNKLTPKTKWYYHLEMVTG